MRIFILLVLFVSISITTLAEPQKAEEQAKPAPLTVAELWSNKCQRCHGATGKADTTAGKKMKIEDFSEASWQKKPRHTDEFIKTSIEKGIKGTKMPAFQNKITPEQIAELVTLIRSFEQK